MKPCLKILRNQISKDSYLDSDLKIFSDYFNQLPNYDQSFFTPIPTVLQNSQKH